MTTTAELKQQQNSHPVSDAQNCCGHSPYLFLSHILSHSLSLTLTHITYICLFRLHIYPNSLSFPLSLSHTDTLVQHSYYLSVTRLGDLLDFG